MSYLYTVQLKRSLRGKCSSLEMEEELIKNKILSKFFTATNIIRQNPMNKQFVRLQFELNRDYSQEELHHEELNIFKAEGITYNIPKVPINLFEND